MQNTKERFKRPTSSRTGTSLSAGSGLISTIGAMQSRELYNQNTSLAGPGLEGALGPCVKVGKENRGRQRLIRSDALIKKKDKK